MALIDRLPGEPPDDRDLAMLIDQLGYLRYMPLRVIRRDGTGRPGIVLSFFSMPPRVRSTTTSVFWITDPVVRAAVGRFEAAGAVVDLNARVGADPDLARRLRDDQHAYHVLVVGLYREVLGEVPPRPYAFGIGGVRELEQIKCLHAHLAFHLATGRSWVGRCVAERLAAEWTGPRAR